MADLFALIGDRWDGGAAFSLPLPSILPEYAVGGMTPSGNEPDEWARLELNRGERVCREDDAIGKTVLGRCIEGVTMRRSEGDTVDMLERGSSTERGLRLLGGIAEYCMSSGKVSENVGMLSQARALIGQTV